VYDIAGARYEGGLATSLDVITAQQSLLNSQRAAVQILGQQMTTSVFLVKAVGGDWNHAIAAPRLAAQHAGPHLLARNLPPPALAVPLRILRWCPVQGGCPAAHLPGAGHARSPSLHQQLTLRRTHVV
ncbi:hypothetical protein NMT61_25390, partial [Escherichia coli]|nr:hypothetical protein [Escherichia coli]